MVYIWRRASHQEPAGVDLGDHVLILVDYPDANDQVVSGDPYSVSVVGIAGCVF